MAAASDHIIPDVLVASACVSHPLHQQGKNEDIGGEEETAVSKTLNFSLQPIQFDNQRMPHGMREAELRYASITFVEQRAHLVYISLVFCSPFSLLSTQTAEFPST